MFDKTLTVLYSVSEAGVSLIAASENTKLLEEKALEWLEERNAEYEYSHGSYYFSFQNPFIIGYESDVTGRLIFTEVPLLGNLTEESRLLPMLKGIRNQITMLNFFNRENVIEIIDQKIKEVQNEQ